MTTRPSASIVRSAFKRAKGWALGFVQAQHTQRGHRCIVVVIVSVGSSFCSTIRQRLMVEIHRAGFVNEQTVLIVPEVFAYDGRAATCFRNDYSAAMLRNTFVVGASSNGMRIPHV